MYKWILGFLGLASPAWSVQAPLSCFNKAVFSSVYQDGATGKLFLDFPRGATSWTAEVKFSFPVERMTVWDSLKSVCNDNTCRFNNPDWKTNILPGGIAVARFELGFQGYDPPKVEKIIVNNQIQCSSRTGGRSLSQLIQVPIVVPRGFSTCGKNMYTSVYQDGAVGDLSIPFVSKVQGWNATITFSSPVIRMEVWDSEWIQCRGHVCKFGSASWVRNVAGGQILKLGFEVEFKGFEAPEVVKLVVNDLVICDRTTGDNGVDYKNEYPDMA